MPSHTCSEACWEVQGQGFCGGSLSQREEEESYICDSWPNGVYCGQPGKATKVIYTCYSCGNSFDGYYSWAECEGVCSPGPLGSPSDSCPKWLDGERVKICGY